MKRSAVSLCVTLVCGPAFLCEPASANVATEIAAIEAKLKTCLDSKGGSTTVGMNECTDVADTAADKILNRVYSALVDGLKHPGDGEADSDAETLKRLVASERAWVVYRDKDCSYASTSMLGGTGESTVYGACLYEKTKARVKDLGDRQEAH